MVLAHPGRLCCRGRGRGEVGAVFDHLAKGGYVCMYIKGGGVSPFSGLLLRFFGVGVAGKRPDGERMANHMLEDMHHPVEWR